LKATIVNIGDEILIGQIVNTNSVYLSRSLNNIGIEVVEILSISDNKEVIIDSISRVEKISEIVIITGGLGPTKDDLTKITLCEYFNDELVLYPNVLNHIEEMFNKYISTSINEKNRKQAFLPRNSKIYLNNYGTASGMLFKKNNNLFFSLPGVPYEMKMLMENSVIPELKKSFSLPYIYHKTIVTYGLGESVISKRIESWESSLPKDIKLAYLPGLGRVRLRVSSKGEIKEKVIDHVEKYLKKLIPLIHDVYFGEDQNEPLEKKIALKFKKLKKTLSVAESCTGGRLCSKLVDHPGASSFFFGGTIVYSDSSKEKILGLSKKLIKKHGTVSSHVAESMALNVKERFNTDFGISITGNAGPERGDLLKKTGSVFIGLAKPSGVKSFDFQLGMNREQIIEKSTNKALEILYKEITSYNI
jgi:nicotinamide-nucleotide amidase